MGFLFFEGVDSILEDFKVLLDFAFEIIFFLFILTIDFISLIEVLSGPLSGDHDIVVKVFLGKNVFGGGFTVIDLIITICEVRFLMLFLIHTHVYGTALTSSAAHCVIGLCLVFIEFGFGLDPVKRLSVLELFVFL